VLQDQKDLDPYSVINGQFRIPVFEYAVYVDRKLVYFISNLYMGRFYGRCFLRKCNAQHFGAQNTGGIGERSGSHTKFAFQ